MSIKNIEDLRKRIHYNLKTVKRGYLSLGYGISGKLRDEYGIPHNEIYKFNWAGEFPNGWAGDSTCDTYFITEQFYNENIKTDIIMPPKNPYTAAQEAFIKLTGLKVGSKVRITSKASNGQYGWGANWNPNMDGSVNDGNLYRVHDIHEVFGIRVGPWNYPFFALEVPVQIKSVALESGDYEVNILASGNIKVGCQDISYEKLKEIFDVATAAKNG